MKKRLETRIALINKILSSDLKIVGTIGWGKNNTHIIEMEKDGLPPKGISELDFIIVKDHSRREILISLKSSIRYEDLSDIDDPSFDGYKIKQDKLYKPLEGVTLQEFNKQIIREISDLQIHDEDEDREVRCATEISVTPDLKTFHKL